VKTLTVTVNSNQYRNHSENLITLSAFVDMLFQKENVEMRFLIFENMKDVFLNVGLQSSCPEERLIVTNIMLFSS